jgi:hypothetical protein
MDRMSTFGLAKLVLFIGFFIMIRIFESILIIIIIIYI